jgi:hypothetical protein
MKIEGARNLAPTPTGRQSYTPFDFFRVVTTQTQKSGNLF